MHPAVLVQDVAVQAGVHALACAMRQGLSLQACSSVKMQMATLYRYLAILRFASS